MLTQFNPPIRIRTEQSQQFSFSSPSKFDQSFESHQFYDQHISIYIQNLRQIEELQESNKKKSITQQYLLIHEQSGREEKDWRARTKSVRKVENKQIIIPLRIMKVLTGYRKVTKINRGDVYNRAFGAFFGFVIGDAVGSHISNKPYNQTDILDALIMDGSKIYNLNPGQGTDETQIMMALSEGLVQSNSIYNSNVVAQKYLQWLESNPFDLPVLIGISFSSIRKKRNSLDVSTSLTFRSSINEQIDLSHRLIEESLRNKKQQSNLGLIRILPLAIWGMHLNQFQFHRLVEEEMRFFTPNEYVLETAVLFGSVLRCVILTGDHMLAYHQASQWVYNFGSPTLLSFWQSFDSGSPLLPTNTNSNNLKIPLFYSLNSLLQFSQTNDQKKEFINMLTNILSIGFNTDTNCSIVMSLVGAMVGYNGIPQYYRDIISKSTSKKSTRIRKRNYDSSSIGDLVGSLLKSAPQSLRIC